MMAPCSIWPTYTPVKGTKCTGTAAETCGTVRLHFELIKQKKLPFLRIEEPDTLVAVKTARPLEVAVKAT
tara:strand:+ start:270 stop:479 length:210 start_codon:yes stop_codon:yes gene_type:complete